MAGAGPAALPGDALAGGEEMVLEKNVFVERILPASVLRRLDEEETERYRVPFREPGESRRPALTWPRENPLDGRPADVRGRVAAHAGWLRLSALPELFVDAEPGSIPTGAQREDCRRWPNQREVLVRGSHLLQEDSPAEIGVAVASFASELS